MFLKRPKRYFSTYNTITHNCYKRLQIIWSSRNSSERVGSDVRVDHFLYCIRTVVGNSMARTSAWVIFITHGQIGLPNRNRYHYRSWSHLELFACRTRWTYPHRLPFHPDIGYQTNGRIGMANGIGRIGWYSGPNVDEDDPDVVGDGHRNTNPSLVHDYNCT